MGERQGGRAQDGRLDLRGDPADAGGLQRRSSTSTTAPADFDALAAKGVSVKGKLVLVDSDFEGWWLNYPGAEATSRGAIG